MSTAERELPRVCSACSTGGGGGGGATESLDTTAQSQSCHTPTTANTSVSNICSVQFVICEDKIVVTIS